MRVLHVISTMATTSGGPTSVLYDMANHQLLAGIDVTVCTTNRGNPTKIILDETEILRGFNRGVGLRCFNVNHSISLISIMMRRWLKTNVNKYDIVHIHGLYRFPSTYAAYLARNKKVPYVIRPHGSLDPYLYRKSSRSVMLKRLYEKWFDLPNLNAAGSLHYTTEEERLRASFLCLNSPSFIVPNGINWMRFEKLPTRGGFRARLGLSDVPLVLFLGRLHFVKGLDLLIPAFDAVRHTIPGAHLVIAGPENDDYGQEVRNWVRGRGLSERVHFVGYLGVTEVTQAYVDADVFALPSYTENFGMTVVEAMACGLPVVISDQVNIHQEVAKSGGGTVTRCDVDDVGKALITLLKDRELQRDMGVAGRQFVLQQYAWPRIVDMLTREYETVIARSKNNTTGIVP